jgi:hypothetical protein
MGWSLGWSNVEPLQLFFESSRGLAEVPQLSLSRDSPSEQVPEQPFTCASIEIS